MSRRARRQEGMFVCCLACVGIAVWWSDGRRQERQGKARGGEVMRAREKGLKVGE